nr:DNA-directed RNA polymerase subunit alpha [Patescibacteria group bacterium]
MFSPEKVNLKIKSADSKEGVFILSPLPKGFANTLGNSLRRVLLSSVLGTAVTKMYIDGANHEFATLKGIKEDVFLITQNIKKINFAINSEG